MELDGEWENKSARSSRRRRHDGARSEARRGRGVALLLERSNTLVVGSGERDLGEGREPGRVRPTSERCPPALSSALVDRSINQAGLGMVGREITQQMKVLSDPRTEWIVLQPE